MGQIDTQTIRDPIQMLREMGKFFEGALTAHSWNQERIERLEDATQDILHEIELDTLRKGPEAAKLYKELRTIRQERRALKEQNEVLRPLVDWCLKNQSTVHTFTQIQGIMNGTRERQRNRQYRPRTPERANMQLGEKSTDRKERKP